MHAHKLHTHTTHHAYQLSRRKQIPEPGACAALYANLLVCWSNIEVTTADWPLLFTLGAHLVRVLTVNELYFKSITHFTIKNTMYI